MDTLEPQHSHTWIDHIPAIWIEPQNATIPRKLAIWLTGFMGNKEAMLPYLADLARQGFVALSYDSWQHGERGEESPEALLQRVFGNFRRYMWPILAHTTEDSLRVVDWALDHLGVEYDVCMGGISMGGDVAVAAAGIEPRILHVAALNATPDWLRPGMNLAPGSADTYAKHLFYRLNPMLHLEAYAHCPAILFECGAQDDHVPPDGALRFQSELQSTYAGCPDKIQVHLHEGVGHFSTPQMWQNSLDWFAGRV